MLAPGQSHAAELYARAARVELIARRPDLRLLSAVNGTHGIELARYHRPDVILMDINLPGLNGTDAMQILQGNPRTAHIPIIAITANAMPRDVAKGIADGFFRYITKPIVLADFNEALDSALRAAAGQRATVE